MTYFMGVDGGGSNLRVVIIDDGLQVIGESQTFSANPSSIGQEVARERIQSAMRIAAEGADISLKDIEAVCLGIAGAAKEHSADWIQSVAVDVLPDALIVPSSDLEIALVGAHSQPDGMIILAGTGSAVYGTHNGETLRIGGWGYLLGDEGGGYWIGLQALQVMTHWFDGLEPESAPLSRRLLEILDLTDRRTIINWVYRGESRTTQIGRLAPLVMDFAADDDPYARKIIDRAADYLATAATSALERLDLSFDQVAYVGGLIAQETVLSQALSQRLGLMRHPAPRYSSVIGAALLAKQVWEGQKA